MIKEFDLDAPRESKAKRNRFRLLTRSTTALFERGFVASKAIRYWKILVEVVSTIEKPVPRDLLGVLTVQVKGDAGKFLTAPKSEWEKESLRFLMKGVRKICKSKDWSTTPFKDAERFVKDLDYKNYRIWKTSWNDLKSIKAEIVIVHEPANVTIVVKFKDKSDALVCMQNLTVELPTEFVFSNCLGRLDWVSRNSIMLQSKDGNMSWNATCPYASE